MKDAEVGYIGIDVSKDTLCIDDGIQSAATIPNARGDVRKALGGIKREAPGKPPHICFEATGPRTGALAGECRRAGLAYSIPDPLLVKHFAKSPGTAKTDPIDAGVIRRYAEARRPEEAAEPREATERIKRLVLVRDGLVKSVTGLRSILETVGGTAEAGRLRQAIRQLEGKVSKVDGDIGEATKEDGEVSGLVAALAGVKGVGTPAAAKLVAHVPEIGTLGRRKAAKLIGLAPFTRQSGRWKGKSFIGGGRKTMRGALFMPATVAIRCNPELRKFHGRLVANGKPYKVALAAVMRKLFCHLDAVAKRYRASAQGADAPPSSLPPLPPAPPILTLLATPR